jgi:hypothetical protein
MHLYHPLLVVGQKKNENVVAFGTHDVIHGLLDIT